MPVIPMADAARAQFVVRELNADEADHVRHGRRIAASGLGCDPVAAIDPDGALAAMLDETGKVPRSHIVFV